jgi:hypothetical protein
MFAGWNYSAGVTRKPDWVRQAYALGVPMGSNLTARDSASRASAPRFLLHALKDPDGPNLDRIQIVKVWLREGVARERVFDALWSGKRKHDAKTGKLPPVGNTVDVKTATYTNDIGAVQLTGEWTDPAFNPAEPALYYARVVEIPSPRWTTYLAAKSGLPAPEGVSTTIQERAWSSPIFYKP